MKNIITLEASLKCCIYLHYKSVKFHSKIVKSKKILRNRLKACLYSSYSSFTEINKQISQSQKQNFISLTEILTFCLSQQTN